jgi:probable rRNA maturation factor
MSAAAPTRVFGVDEQGDVPIDVGRWVQLAEDVLSTEGVRPDTELSLLFVDEATMADLNERHMGKSGPTDVLAFPIDDDAVDPGRWPDNGTTGPDRPPLDLDELPTLLGDVVVCPIVAARQASEHRGPLHDGTADDEVALLVVHGILHVLGHDHAEPEETERMQAKERSLLERFHRRS